MKWKIQRWSQFVTTSVSLDSSAYMTYDLFMLVTTEIGANTLVDLVRQVQAGNEVLLTQDNQPVAKLVPAQQKQRPPAQGLRVNSLKGHRVLTSVISQAEVADELFTRA